MSMGYLKVDLLLNANSSTVTPSDYPSMAPSKYYENSYGPSLLPTDSPSSHIYLSSNAIIAVVIGILFGCLIFGILIYFIVKMVNCSKYIFRNSYDNILKQKSEEYDQEIVNLTEHFNDPE